MTIPNPAAGDYVIRVVNFAAVGSFHSNMKFAQRTAARESAGAGAPSAAYVGYCGYCDTITQGTPFNSGLATNVGGSGRQGR